MYTEVPQTEKTGQQVAKLPCYADTYSRKPITDIFTKDTDVDKRGRKRTVPMKVLLLAVGRTGTACKSIPPSSGTQSGLAGPIVEKQMWILIRLAQLCARQCNISATSRPTT